MGQSVSGDLVEKLLDDECGCLFGRRILKDESLQTDIDGRCQKQRSTRLPCNLEYDGFIPFVLVLGRSNIVGRFSIKPLLFIAFKFGIMICLAHSVAQFLSVRGNRGGIAAAPIRWELVRDGLGRLFGRLDRFRLDRLGFRRGRFGRFINRQRGVNRLRFRAFRLVRRFGRGFNRFRNRYGRGGNF
jgi:hypothetical protein